MIPDFRHWIYSPNEFHDHMKTAFWLLMEFILFGLGATFGLFSIGGIVTLPSTFQMKSDAAMLGALLVPVVSIALTFLGFKGYGAAARRRRGKHVLKRSITGRSDGFSNDLRLRSFLPMKLITSIPTAMI